MSHDTAPSHKKRLLTCGAERGEKKRNTLIIRFFCLSVFFYIHIYVYLKSEGRQIGRIKRKGRKVVDDDERKRGRRISCES